MVGVVAGGVGLEPCGVIEHPVTLHDDFGLDLEVAFLAEGGEVPPFAVGRIQVEVVNGEAVADFGIVFMSATDAFPAREVFDFSGNFVPIWRILACGFSGHVILLDGGGW